MTTDYNSDPQVYENSKAIVLVGEYAKDLRELRTSRFGTEDSRPSLIIPTNYAAQAVRDADTVNGLVDILTCEGGTEVETVLEKLARKSFSRKELVVDYNMRSRVDETGRAEIDRKYFIEGEEFLDLIGLVDHGVIYQPRFRYPKGNSDVSGANVIASAGPLFNGSNPYDLFRILNLFYDMRLGQKFGRQEREQKREYERFFNCHTLEEAGNHFSETPRMWNELKELLAADGITSIRGIQDRVREFEENFFPGEFEKAAVGIRQTREWLRSLKD